MTAVLVSPTPEEVVGVTGVSLDADAISRARSVVELYSGLDLGETAEFRTSDLRRLRQALVWQAVYMDANPTLFTAPAGVASSSNDGVSVTYRADVSGADAALAPLAAVALKGLSLRRSRSTLMRSDLSRLAWREQDLVNDCGPPAWEQM